VLLRNTVAPERGKRIDSISPSTLVVVGVSSVRGVHKRMWRPEVHSGG